MLLLAQILVGLALLMELVGLAQVDLRVQTARADGDFVASVGPGLIVTPEHLLVQLAPGPTSLRPMFCAETPAALKRFAALAAADGERSFWHVDERPLPDAWLLPAAALPTVLEEVGNGSLVATRYEAVELGDLLRADGPDRDTCGYTVNS